MARKEKIITIKDRDQELTFKIREMSATQLENWLLQATTLLSCTGAESVFKQGIDFENVLQLVTGNALTLLGNLDPVKTRPLLDELLSCCSRMVEGVEEHCTQQTVDNYVQSATTLIRLRMEALKLNLGFCLPELEKNSGSQNETNS